MTAFFLWTFAALAAAIYCLAKAVIDLRARRYVWGAAGLLTCLIHEAAAPGSFGGDLTLAAWPGRAPSSAFFTAAGSMGFSRLMDGAGVSGTAALAMLVQAGDRWRWL